MSQHEGCPLLSVSKSLARLPRSFASMRFQMPKSNALRARTRCSLLLNKQWEVLLLPRHNCLCCVWRVRRVPLVLRSSIQNLLFCPDTLVADLTKPHALLLQLFLDVLSARLTGHKDAVKKFTENAKGPNLACRLGA